MKAQAKNAAVKPKPDIRIVHIETRVESVFGVMDEDGNLVPFKTGEGKTETRILARAVINKFNPESFVEAFQILNGFKEEAKKQLR
jgi:hypothetical protein